MWHQGLQQLSESWPRRSVRSPSERRKNVPSLVLGIEHTILLHNAVGKAMDTLDGRRPIYFAPKSQIHYQWWGHHYASRYRHHHHDASKDIGSSDLQAPNTFMSYQFEIIHTKQEAAELKRKAKTLPPKFNMMAWMKFDLNKSLGKHSQGRKKPIKAVKVLHKAGLGFKALLKHQFKKNKKRKVNYKVSSLFVSASWLSKSSDTLPTLSST